MKNVIKKLSAATLAFVLLGTGSAISRQITPESTGTITANAGACSHIHGTYSTYLWVSPYLRVTQERCNTCNTVLGTHTDYIR